MIFCAAPIKSSACLLRDFFTSLGIHRINKRLQRIDGRHIVLYILICQFLQGRIQLRRQTIRNTFVQIHRRKVFLKFLQQFHRPHNRYHHLIRQRINSAVIDNKRNRMHPHRKFNRRTNPTCLILPPTSTYTSAHPHPHHSTPNHQAPPPPSRLSPHKQSGRPQRPLLEVGFSAPSAIAKL